MPLWTSRLLPTTSASNTAAPAQGSTRSLPDASKPRSRPVDSSANHTGVPTLQPQPLSNPGQSKTRTRSFSNAIPTLLGGVKKRTNDSDVNTSTAAAPSRKYEDNELEVVVCATCDTKAKIPRSILEYRCSTCLMINDSKINSGKGLAPTVGAEDDAADQTLSLERTRALAGTCLRAYLSTWHTRPRPNETDVGFFPLILPNESHMATSPTRPPRRTTSIGTGDNHEGVPFGVPSGACVPVQSPPASIAPEAFARQSPMNTKRAQNSQPSQPSQDTGRPGTESTARPKLPPFTLPIPPPDYDLSYLGSPVSPPLGGAEILATSPRSPPLGAVDNFRSASKAIFKPLEACIIKTFANFESLNSAFCFPKAKTPDSKLPVGSAEPQETTPTIEYGVPTVSQISDLDAKTLLIGDIGENGLWWTGRNNSSPLPTRRVKQQGSSDVLKSTTQLRSPRIHWSEVHQWYDYVLSVGVDWLDHIEASDGIPLTQGETAADIAICVADARAHVQRTLLKASESLLKRPGRLIKTPEDTRFLLILLANPLLHPVTAVKFAGRSVGTPAMEKRPMLSYQARGSTWEQGHAFGIIKRILGLMSNLSNECHRHLTAWFARYDSDRFQVLVEIVQSLVTHRFGRQHHRKRSTGDQTMTDSMPELATDVPAELHAALGLPAKPKYGADGKTKPPIYSDDWQVKAAARVMALLFAANKVWQGQRVRKGARGETCVVGPAVATGHTKKYSPLLSTSQFYNTMVDYSDLVADFETWESSKGRFAFCQYPFFLSVSAKIRILEHDAKRQMEVKAREAFFNSILRNKAIEQFLVLKVRRDCLVEDSLKGIGEVVGAGQEEIKKGLKIQFVNEEGVDAGGLRKEWFLLLVREIFDPHHGMFVYDDESRLCYFNPDTFETSDQFFLVGALLGLAIYNSTILDVALPPFLFKKLLASGPSYGASQAHANRHAPQYTLEDLAEYRPSLARGLRQLLDFDGNVEETFCRDFVAEVDRYGTIAQVPLRPDGANKPVTNANRQQFVDAYIKFLLDTQVARQFEPFKRGFFKVCGGNALSLFQPEEIELLVRGSDEPLDVPTLKAVAVYENWRRGERQIERPEEIDLVQWFWEAFENAKAQDQRRILSFVTGSDRIPAAGAASLIIKIQFAGKDGRRFPTARTCFNSLLLYKYATKQDLVHKLWRAITESEGFGLK